MSGFFYRLGRMAGPSVRKGKWFWQSLTGNDADVIKAEQNVGRDLAQAFRQELPPDSDANRVAAVNDIGARLAACVRNKLRTFAFTVVVHEKPNAFALPGGFVFLTRPLLELVGGDPNELAFVLGHEMGHVIQQDPMQRAVTDTAIGAALRALPGSGMTGSWAKSVGARLLQSAYSQDRELEADKLGARLSRAAGYDTTGGIRLLQRLKQAAGPDQNLPLGEYFSTHPPFDTRIQHLERFLKQRS